METKELEERLPLFPTRLGRTCEEAYLESVLSNRLQYWETRVGNTNDDAVEKAINETAKIREFSRQCLQERDTDATVSVVKERLADAWGNICELKELQKSMKKRVIVLFCVQAFTVIMSLLSVFVAFK